MMINYVLTHFTEFIVIVSIAGPVDGSALLRQLKRAVSPGRERRTPTHTTLIATRMGIRSVGATWRLLSGGYLLHRIITTELALMPNCYHYYYYTYYYCRICGIRSTINEEQFWCSRQSNMCYWHSPPPESPLLLLADNRLSCANRRNHMLPAESTDGFSTGAMIRSESWAREEVYCIVLITLPNLLGITEALIRR